MSILSCAISRGTLRSLELGVTTANLRMPDALGIKGTLKTSLKVGPLVSFSATAYARHITPFRS